MAIDSTSQTLKVLLVEDDPGDILLTKKALQDCPCEVCVVTDGVQALDFLKQATSYPDLLLMDLNLPKLDGKQLLSTVKTDPSLAEIPIVVLTTSDRDDDIQRMTALGADSYVTKPIEVNAYLETVRSIAESWLTADTENE